MRSAILAYPVRANAIRVARTAVLVAGAAMLGSAQTVGQQAPLPNPYTLVDGWAKLPAR